MGGVIMRYGDAGEGEFEEHPATFVELKSRLQAIRMEYHALLHMPYSVDLIREGVGRMSVGLGNGEWIVFFQSADEERVLNSLGDDKADGEVQFYFGDVTLLSRRYLIPRTKALEVVRAWFEEGALSNVIRWTDKIY